MKTTYRLKVAGLERELPICPLNEKMSIDAFIMLSDVELTVACAKMCIRDCCHTAPHIFRLLPPAPPPR